MGWFSKNDNDSNDVDVLISESEAAAQDIEDALNQLDDYNDRQQAEADELIEESNGLLGKLFGLFGVVMLCVALQAMPVKAQDVQPVPTPSISTPPDGKPHMSYLALIMQQDLVGGSVSWRPGGSVVSYEGHGGHGSFGGK